MKWISVKDRLPEENHDLFIITDGKCVGFGYSDFSGFVGCEKDFLNEITHWMPLPAPPEER